MLRATASGYKLILYCTTMSRPLTGDEQAISKLPYWSLAQALARLSCALQCALCEAAIESHFNEDLEAVGEQPSKQTHVLHHIVCSSIIRAEQTRQQHSAHHRITRSAMLCGSVACPRRARTRGLIPTAGSPCCDDPPNP